MFKVVALIEVFALKHLVIVGKYNLNVAMQRAIVEICTRMLIINVFIDC